jgi:drug/metabolite transporter (DMT)-like permease
MSTSTGYALILATVLLTVYGQLVIKWQVLKAGILPELFGMKLLFLAKLLLNPWILTALGAAFLASITWMAAMTKLPLTHGYPLTSLSFILIMLSGHFILGESVGLLKVLGTLLIMVGIVLISNN